MCLRVVEGFGAKEKDYNEAKDTIADMKECCISVVAEWIFTFRNDQVDLHFYIVEPARHMDPAAVFSRVTYSCIENGQRGISLLQVSI